MKKRVLALLIITCLLMGNAYQIIPQVNATEQGRCGDNLTWEFDYANGKLAISGSGDMYDYTNFLDVPWWELRKRITAISLSPGISSIGVNAFSLIELLESVDIPESVLHIGEQAFSACRNLKEIKLREGLQSIGREAFTNVNIKSLIIPSTVTTIEERAFLSCVFLKDVYFWGDRPTIGEHAFSIFNDGTISRFYFILDDLTFYFIEGCNGWTLPECNGYHTAIWQNPRDDSQTDTDVVQDAHQTPEESDQVQKFSSYEEVVQSIIDSEKGGNYWPKSCGKLYDLNGDKKEELILLHHLMYDYYGGGEKIPCTVCSIYTQAGSFAVPLIKNEPLCADAGGPFSNVYIAKKAGNTYVLLNGGAAYSSGANDYFEEGFWSQYSLEIQNASCLTRISYRAYEDCIDNQYWTIRYADSYADIDGKRYGYDTLENWVNSFEVITVMGTSADSDGILLQELLEDLQYDEQDIQDPPLPQKDFFNEYFVVAKRENVQDLVDYESVAKTVCEESSSAEIYWNAYLSALSDSKFLSVDNIGDASLSPLKMHHYYEAALLEAITQTKLENDYLAAIGDRALKTAVEAASFCVQYNSEFESREDVLKRKLKEETRYLDRDGEEIIKIYEYYGAKCKDLETYDVVKSIYDLCLESDATIEEFYLALSNYVEVKQASDEVFAALEYLKDRLELSNDKEDKIILTAVENVITSLTIALDTHLVYNVLESMQDQFWNMMIGMAEDLLGEYFLVAKAAKMCIDGGLLLMDVLFPTATSSKSYCKLYADFAIERVVQDAIYAAYDEYSISPRKEMADAIVGLYDVLAYTYQHEIQVGNVLVEQLHKDGLLNGLRNLVSSSNMEDYRYEKACIQSYDAYLAEITKVKAEAQREYGIVIGKSQPVYIVYFINGKALLFEEFTTETGVPYIAPVERAEKVANALGFKADVMGVYSDSTMTKAYDDTIPVSGPVTLFMDVGLFHKSDGTPALVDPATNVSITKTGIPANTKISVTKEMEGTDYKAATARFEGRAIEMYDISLSAEEGEVQPSGTVTVSIPLKADCEGNDVSVYYMASNGTYEDMEAMVEDGYCKFTTTHFSTYVIVYESSDTLNNLTMTIVIVSTVVVSALVVLIVIIRARRKKRKS